MIARFRTECQDVFTALFTQVLMIAGRAGLAQFGTVAIDGTKIAANASIYANRGQEWLSKQVESMVTQAQAADNVEDLRAATHDGDGERVPAPLVQRPERAARIRAAADEVATLLKRKEEDDRAKEGGAKARLAKALAGEPMVGRIPNGPHRLAEAQAHLDREIAMQQAKLDRRAALLAAGKKPMGSPPVGLEQHSRIIRARKVVDAARVAQAKAKTSAVNSGARMLPKVVANVTDPQSKMMPTRRGFLQGYNVQVAVTADQIIAAVQLGQNPNDQAALVPMMEAATQAAAMLHSETGRAEHTLGVVLADAGYCSDSNLAAPGPDRLIALGKGRTQAAAVKQQPVTGPAPVGATPRQAMSHKLRTPEGAALYKRRGATVEPGIGNLKKILDRFSRRGLDGALSELNLAASAFNLMKIHQVTTA